MPKPNKTGRYEVITLRARREPGLLINRAAEALGRSRSDFMLSAACREAELVLRDRRNFALSTEAFRLFRRMIDSPPTDNPRLRRLLQTKAPLGPMNTISPDSIPVSQPWTIGFAAVWSRMSRAQL